MAMSVAEGLHIGRGHPTYRSFEICRSGLAPVTGLFPRQRRIRMDARANGLHGQTNAIVRFKEMTMATGTVKFFNGQKGFGFIAQDGGGPDVFVHVSAVERAGMRGLAEGQKVTFDIEADRKNGKSAATNLQAA